MESLKFVDLFAGLGGFHVALESLGHECVFASELDAELRRLYGMNFRSMSPNSIAGDIRDHWQDVPRHDILCAGFPCQPFSKSGSQLGTRDKTRGTLFHEIVRILEHRKPSFVLLENVGNFARHDKGRTWTIVRESLRDLGYAVQGTEHVTPRPEFDWRDRAPQPNQPRTRSVKASRSGTGGSGLLSPHHFGYPHHRERFFIVASRNGLPIPAFPPKDRKQTSLAQITLQRGELSAEEKKETALASQQRRCIEHWNALVRALPEDLNPPSFPLWGDELGARYPFESRTPWATPPGELRRLITSKSFPPYTRKPVLLEALPSYAREPNPTFRAWKIHYIRQNREWWKRAKPHLPQGWQTELRSFPASLRKLEWNVKGEKRDIWQHVLQFRPSGLRVKRYESSPALVAMTATQIPILGPERRFLTRKEGLRLQDLPDEHLLPRSRAGAFKALGNAVHAGVAARIAKNLMGGRPTRVAPLVAYAHP